MYAGQGSEILDASGVHAVGHEGKGNGQRQLRPLWTVWATRLGEACKTLMAQRKGQYFKGSQKGNSGLKGSWTGPSWTSGSHGKAGKGFQIRLWAQNQYRKRLGKQKGLDEVSDWSQDVWDLHGIHALTGVLSQASPNHARLRQPLPCLLNKPSTNCRSSCNEYPQATKRCIKN